MNKEGFTLCGGGRYDNLVYEIDGKEAQPSVGFGMGIERILYFLEKENINLAPEKPIDLYVGIMGDSAKAKAYKLVYDLRLAGYIVETDYKNRSVKAQMKYANKLNARYTIIIGDNELETNTGRIKNMETGEQTEIALDQLASVLEER